MSAFTDQIDSDDIDVVRAVARELARDLRSARDQIGAHEVTTRAYAEALRDARESRALEHARATEHIELLRQQLKVSEADVAALQSLLAIICDTGTSHLAELLGWVWQRSTPDEIMSMMLMRDALWQMVGMCQTFARERRVE